MGIVCFHNPNEENGYLSNWYPACFTVDGVKFSSMEQFMMYRKAVRFHDDSIAVKILNTDDSSEIKSLGRLVSGYEEHDWNGMRQIRQNEVERTKFAWLYPDDGEGQIVRRGCRLRTAQAIRDS